MSGDPPRVVYDCMIFLQAAARPQRVHGTMRLVHEGRVSLCVSPAIVAEVRDVLTRPEVAVKLPALRAEHVDTFLDDLLARAVMLHDVRPSGFTLPRDPKDQPYVDLAVAAGASYLVTWNERHLTYLMRKDTPEGVEFCDRFPTLAIINPPDFVNQIEGRQA